MLLAAEVDWTTVILAAIAIVPATISAIGVVLVHQAIRTPSGTSIGKQVEGANHTVIGNNHRLQAIGQQLQTPPSTEAASHEAQAEKANGGTTKPPDTPPAFTGA